MDDQSFQALLIILTFGAFGGFAQSLRTQHRYRLPLFWKERSWSTGFLGHVLIGALAAFVISGVLTANGGLEVEELFQPNLPIVGIPDGASPEAISVLMRENRARTQGGSGWFLSFVTLASVSAAAGFAGLTILTMAGDDLKNAVGQNTEDIEDLEVKSTLVLGIVSIAENQPALGVRLLRKVLDHKDADEETRSIGLLHIARGEKRLGNYREALRYIEERIGITPDSDVAVYNRACYNWLEFGVRKIDDVLVDLDTCERLKPRSALDFVEEDPDFVALTREEKFAEWKNSHLRTEG